MQYFVFAATVFRLIFFVFVENTKVYAIKELFRSRVDNISILFLNSIILSLISFSSLLAAASNFSGFGILDGELDLMGILISFVLFDAVLYFWHRAVHKYEWLWYFHQVHHSDIAINMTTAFRLNFVEVLFTALVKIIFIITVGVSMELVLLYELIISCASVFDHTNISFPSEKKWAKVFIVPYLHRIHHSTDRSEHDKNFGQVFSLWDRLFGTFIDTKVKNIGLHYGEQRFFQLVFPRKLK